MLLAATPPTAIDEGTGFITLADVHAVLEHDKLHCFISSVLNPRATLRAVCRNVHPCGQQTYICCRSKLQEQAHSIARSARFERAHISHQWHAIDAVPRARHSNRMHARRGAAE